MLTGTFTPQNKTELHTAVNAYIDGDTMTYGDISGWNTSLITDMSELFEDKSTFNEDINLLIFF